jgi:glycine C-acetyltransferase
MPIDRLQQTLARELEQLERKGVRKGPESVVTEVLRPEGGRGPRYRLAGEGERCFLRMNSNGYLGMALHPEVLAAEERAARAFGAGPQAVRFIAGTCAPHVALETRLARFHGREACMLYSSAYAAVMGVLPPLITAETAVISDALNHNCIINAARLARPGLRRIYAHLDVDELEAALAEAAGACRRALIVTDGVFSMRGDHAPLERIAELASEFDSRFPENVVVVVDDSHGTGAWGATGRGTEEVTRTRADVLVATLGKALGVNGGYVVGPQALVGLLREQSPFYVYSNPITPGEAAAAERALELLEQPEGLRRLRHLGEMTRRFRRGLASLGFESVGGEHPVVPLMVRDGERTRALVRHLRDRGVLVTGIHPPVVPPGDEAIRFQVSADHTAEDVDEVLAALAAFPGGGS